MPWFPHGLRNGVLTTGWPRTGDAYFDEFPAAVHVADAARSLDPGVAAAARACPTRAIDDAGGTPTVDRGRCILCRRCTTIAPDVFSLAGSAAVASVGRSQLVVPEAEGSDLELAELTRALARRVRRLRRSVHIRHVDVGSDGAEEWEVQALLNPVYDIHRLGIFFTASPRHADLLLATGIGAAGMVEPLHRTIAGMPDPVVVIAVGTDAISGGLIGGGYTNGTGLAPLAGVDVWVPGSPPSPFSILHGILLALGRLPDETRRAG